MRSITCARRFRPLPSPTKAGVVAVRTELRIIGAIVLTIAAKLFGIFNAVASVLS